MSVLFFQFGVNSKIKLVLNFILFVEYLQLVGAITIQYLEEFQELLLLQSLS